MSSYHGSSNKQVAYGARQPAPSTGYVVKPKSGFTQATENGPDWQNTLYNGLVTQGGHPTLVASGNITKPMIEKQIPEHMIPTLEVFSNNSMNHGLHRKAKSKQRFSVHRSMSFLPQE